LFSTSPTRKLASQHITFFGRVGGEQSRELGHIRRRFAMLASCQPPPGPPPPPDPAVVMRIVTACTGSGLFKLAGGALEIAVPATALPVAVVNAGVDKVCADPARFAGDVSTVEWVVKNLRTSVRS
jgi:hypothetical protein